MASQLDSLVELSPSIARLQALFKAFIGLCKGLVASDAEIRSPMTRATANDDLHITSDSSHIFSTEQMGIDRLHASLESQRMPSIASTPIVETIPQPEITPAANLSWELFDVQPTLDWLDVDFSFFDSNI